MIRINWTEFKNYLNNNPSAAEIHHVEATDKYHVWTDWHDMKIATTVFKDGSADQTDFENNYKAASNQPRFPRTRITTCMGGRKAHYRYVTFTTASQGTYNDDDELGNDFGEVTYTMYDTNNDVTTTNAEAVRTHIDFFPSYDYEISGGKLCIPSILAGSDDDKWEAFVVGAPDIPKASGGSVRFLNNNRLKWDKGGTIHMDEQLNPAEISGSASSLARKIRIILSHPAGAQSEFQIMLKLYKEPTA